MHGTLCLWHRARCKDTVTEQCQDNEVNGGEHPRADAALRLYPVVHHCVPVFPRQDLHSIIRERRRKGDSKERQNRESRGGDSQLGAIQNWSLGGGKMHEHISVADCSVGHQPPSPGWSHPGLDAAFFLWHGLRRGEDRWWGKSVALFLPSLSYMPAARLWLQVPLKPEKVVFQHFTRSKTPPSSPFLSHAEIPAFNSSTHIIPHRPKKTLTSKPTVLSGISASINSFDSLHTARVCSAPPQPTHTTRSEWRCNWRNSCNSLPLSLYPSGLQTALHVDVTPNARHRAAQPRQGLPGGCTTTGSPGFPLTQATKTLHHPDSHKPQKNP